MIRMRRGVVKEITSHRPGVTELLVEVEGNTQKAINYDELTGQVRPGDEVILNTTAVYKKLGTGGAHFVVGNLSHPEVDVTEIGHIMKMRYSPCQVKVLSVEEPDSPFAEAMRQASSLEGIPVIIGTLHSMIAPAAAALKKLGQGQLKVAYLMTDGAALPLPLSRLVYELKQKGLIHRTVTCGHAFGGDLEAINVYTGLLACRAVVKADVIIVAMGPGIVGSASQYGFTGVEQGEIINAVNILGGKPIAIPRISFADARERHRGLSHHSRTALGKIALTKATVTLPKLAPDKMELVLQQTEVSGISQKHDLAIIEARPALEALKEYDIKVTTMGRNVEQDPEFFLAAGAAGVYVSELV
ncbi:hypothetical protein Desca_2080 [Desulfotomaculum nigrificans CO-1-SRB]|uniref:DUF3866 domain-containing protein n=1 Tax=Desulfotomaculum nigrificans (strain DSM 14880 / VKM B-2319 / CO-1-SRB) TaxID=868595 RepID=F6B9M3_DESCC|nr:DUF3866 family protein [Desulfotomaculum nigrificans]AEF94919.1 hypothetical protein Desca_2080 [Desulfotomaculum nigrificans CO-1-SRB]